MYCWLPHVISCHLSKMMNFWASRGTNLRFKFGVVVYFSNPLSKQTLVSVEAPYSRCCPCTCYPCHSPLHLVHTSRPSWSAFNLQIVSWLPISCSKFSWSQLPYRYWLKCRTNSKNVSIKVKLTSLAEIKVITKIARCCVLHASWSLVRVRLLAR